MEWLYDFDMGAFRAIHLRLHSAFLDPLFFILSWSGLGWIQFVASMLLWLREETKRFVAPLLWVIVVSGVPVAQGVKYAMMRDRPSYLFFAHPQEPIHTRSFPSGHTTTSFAIAALLLLMTWRTPNAKWAWLALVWAALVGVSRIYRGVHWPTDVLAGICAGVFSACLVYLLMPSARAEPT